MKKRNAKDELVPFEEYGTFYNYNGKNPSDCFVSVKRKVGQNKFEFDSKSGCVESEFKLLVPSSLR